MRRSRPTSCPRSANRPGRLEACRRSRRAGKARVSDGSDAWRSEPSNGGFHEPSGVLSSMVKPWLVGVVEPVLGTEPGHLAVVVARAAGDEAGVERGADYALYLALARHGK